MTLPKKLALSRASMLASVQPACIDCPRVSDSESVQNAVSSLVNSALNVFLQVVPAYHRKLVLTALGRSLRRFQMSAPLGYDIAGNFCREFAQLLYFAGRKPSLSSGAVLRVSARLWNLVRSQDFKSELDFVDVWSGVFLLASPDFVKLLARASFLAEASHAESL